jgi:hypothetical protein
MKQFKLINRPSSTVQNILEIWDYLNLDPPYQREGNIWSLSKKRLFIDSLINGFDVPKFYFNKVNSDIDVDGELKYIRYSVVDGKQRLETIHEFMTDQFDLGNGIILYDQPETELTSMKASEIRKKYSDIYFDLSRYQLDIILLDNTDEKIVDEFFIRLNEGVSLNAQEKRNAIHCRLGTQVNEIADENDFVTRKLRKKTRYKNRELVAKFFAIVQQFNAPGTGIKDTKKSTLDLLYKQSEKQSITDSDVSLIAGKVKETLDSLARLLQDQDPLLYSVGNVVVFFYAALKQPDTWRSQRVQTLLRDFEKKRKEDYRDVDPSELGKEQQTAYYLFDDYNTRVQSTNDGSAIERRAELINFWLQANGDLEGFIRLGRTDDSEKIIDAGAFDLE